MIRAAIMVGAAALAAFTLPALGALPPPGVRCPVAESTAPAALCGPTAPHMLHRTPTPWRGGVPAGLPPEFYLERSLGPTF